MNIRSEKTSHAGSGGSAAKVTQTGGARGCRRVLGGAGFELALTATRESCLPQY